MILDNDLKMFAAMNGIDRTSDHAMRIGAGSARGRDHKMVQTSSISEQTWDRDPVRRCAMPLDATFGACITPRAVIQVEHENALALIETLRNVCIEDAMAHVGAAQTSQRLLDDPSAKNAELAIHLEEIRATELRQLQWFSAEQVAVRVPGGKARVEIVSGSIER